MTLLRPGLMMICDRLYQNMTWQSLEIPFRSMGLTHILIGVTLLIAQQLNDQNKLQISTLCN